MNGKQLAGHLGISYRQVDHWTRAGYLNPDRPEGRGSGNPRHYDQHQVNHAWLMVELTSAGLTPQAAHDLATDLETDLSLGGQYEHLGRFTITWDHLVCGLCGDWLGPEPLEGYHDDCVWQADNDLQAAGYIRGRPVEDVPDQQRRFS